MLSAAAFSNLLSAKNSPPAVVHITASPLAECLLQELFDFDPVRRVLAYKRVANQVKPVATTMPAHARIVRQFPEEPLLSLPTVSPILPTLYQALNSLQTA
jgi:hypothetical protein